MCACWDIVPADLHALLLLFKCRSGRNMTSSATYYSSGLPIPWKQRPFLQLYILNNYIWWQVRVQRAVSDHERSNEFWLFWGANSPILPSPCFSWGVWNAWAVCQSRLFHCFCVRVLALQWIIHHLYSQTSTLINYDFSSASTASKLMAQSLMVFWGRKSFLRSLSLHRQFSWVGPGTRCSPRIIFHQIEPSSKKKYCKWVNPCSLKKWPLIMYREVERSEREILMKTEWFKTTGQRCMHFCPTSNSKQMCLRGVLKSHGNEQFLT